MTSSLPRTCSTPEPPGLKISLGRNLETRNSKLEISSDTETNLENLMERETGFEPATLSLEG